MWHFALVILILAAGCAPRHVTITQGQIIHHALSQTKEQCKAQPNLDWCRK